MSVVPIGAQAARQRPPVATWALILANTAIFFYFWLQGPKAFQRAIEAYGMIPYYILRGERLYTILTAMFMHGGPLHLIGNMIYLGVFGPGVELRLGRLRYLVFYLVAGVVAAVVHIIIEAFFSAPIVVYGPFGGAVVDPLRIPCVGASGAISGVLGAYMLLLPHATVDLLTMYGPFPVVIRMPAALFIGFWFLYQLWMGVCSLALPAPYFSGVAFWAHIGGFLAGIALAPLMAGSRRARKVYVDREGRVWYEIPVS